MESLIEQGLEEDAVLEGQRDEKVSQIVDELQGVKFSLIGEVGARALDMAEEVTIRMDNLAIARQMEERGDSALDIRMATGWERGADGLWRYELMDAEVSLYDGNEAKIRKQIEVAEEEEKVFMQQSKADTKELRERTNTYLAEMREKYGVAEGEETDAMTEEEIAHLQSLTGKEMAFEDYKERRRNELYNRRMALEAQLAYVITKNTDSDAMIQTARLGHILQGKNANAIFTAYPSLRDMEVQFVTDIRDGAFAAYATKGGYKRIELNAKKTPVDMLTYYLMHEVQHAIQDVEGFAGGGNLSSLQNNREATAKEAYDYYRKIAGEVEARNVSTRLNMSAEERLNTLLSETEDVAREDQIFLRDGVEMAMAKNAVLPKEEYAKLASTIMTRQHTYGRPSFDYAFTFDNFYVYDYLGDGDSIINFALPIIGNEDLITNIETSIDNGTITSSGSLDTFVEEIQSGKRGDVNYNANAFKKYERYRGVHIHIPSSTDNYSGGISEVGGIDSGRSARGGASWNANESANQGLNTKHSLITPEMDADYLSAVERGDMATAQQMVMEAAKLAMPNTKVVDKNGNPKVVYHQTNGSVYINRETGQNWDELDWRERMEWDERDDWDDYWEEREFNTFSRVNARTTQELDGFFFAPEYDEYHEYGNRTIEAFLNIENPASFGDYNIDSSKTNAGRDERIRLQNEGYDGVINEEDGAIWEYVAFSPNQIKSADPVTYDDNGNVIPLSERFNPEKEDIRYSISQEDIDVALENFTLTKDNVNDFCYALMQMVTGRAYFDYGIVGDMEIRIKDHTPDWDNFLDWDTDEAKYPKILNVTVGDYNNTDYRRNKRDYEEFVEKHPETTAVNVEIEDGAHLEDAVAKIHTALKENGIDFETTPSYEWVETYSEEKNDLSNLKYSRKFSLQSVAPYVSYAKNMARALNIAQPIIVADTTDEFVNLLHDAGSKNPERARAARGVYRPDDDAIFLNAEKFENREDLYSTILHEWTHAYTQRNISKLEAILATLDEERVKAAGAELLPDFYKNESPLTILNEIISNFVEDIPKPLLLSIMRGQLSVEEMLSEAMSEISEEEYADIYEAVMPVVKENIINQKERYNGKREEPIVVARWMVAESTQENERPQQYPYRGRQQGGDTDGFAQYRAADDSRGARESAQEVTRYHLPDPDPSDVFYDENFNKVIWLPYAGSHITLLLL